MRSFRTSLAGLALAAIAVAGSSTAVLGADQTKFTVHDVWTFVDGDTTYQFDMTHDVKFLDKRELDGQVSIRSREHTEIYRGGQLVGVVDELSKDRTMFVDGGLASLSSKVKSIATFDGQTCTYTASLKIQDYAVVIDKSTLDCV